MLTNQIKSRLFSHLKNTQFTGKYNTKPEWRESAREAELAYQTELDAPNMYL